MHLGTQSKLPDMISGDVPTPQKSLVVRSSRRSHAERAHLVPYDAHYRERESTFKGIFQIPFTCGLPDEIQGQTHIKTWNSTAFTQTDSEDDVELLSGDDEEDEEGEADEAFDERQQNPEPLSKVDALV
jgi:hypothetical protein